jgi:putative transposase
VAYPISGAADHAETAISATSVHSYFRLMSVQSHRRERLKLSTDPFFMEKLPGVVGLYASLPENALVFCVDEKSRCQALEPSPCMLPMNFGYEGVTHDCVRHGITTLFTALNVLNRVVLATYQARRRRQEFLSFLLESDKVMPADLDVNSIVDNYGSHKYTKVKAWLVTRPRWHMHFIPI